jgi:hypothetical protein
LSPSPDDFRAAREVTQTVVPLVFDVDRTGFPRLRRDTGLRSTGTAAEAAALAEEADASGPYIAPDQAIQALLATAAFPVAFGARAVCECQQACGAGQREVTAEQCPGPVREAHRRSGPPAYSAARGGRSSSLPSNPHRRGF